MNITVVVPNTDIKTDSIVYCEAFEKLGHTVNKVVLHNNKVISDKPLENSDVIWCPYEQEIEIGLFLKKYLKVPLVGHFEWCPPWRVGMESPEEWGYEKNQVSPEEIRNFQKHYKRLIDNYKECDCRTIVNDYCYQTLKFLDETVKESGLIYKPYIVDDTLLLQKKDYNLRKKNQILTIGRLVPHKRISHIIKALSIIRNKEIVPLLKIIGYGPEENNLRKLADELNVKIEFVGRGDDGDKATHIQESMFLVTPCASLPAGEAALFKVSTIMYDVETIEEKHGDIGVFCKNNDIEELADCITDLITYDRYVSEGKRAYTQLMKGESGLCVSEVAAKKMITMFKTVIK